MSKLVANLVFNPFVNDSRVLKESESLARGGYRVEVIAHGDKNLPVTEDKEQYVVKRLSYLDREVTKSKFFKIKAYFCYIKKSVAYCKNFNILHCNDLNTLPIAFVIKTLYNKDIKVVYDAHEYEINDIAEQSRYSIKIKYYIEKFLIKYADSVITVSSSIADDYMKLYNIKRPALVLNTPVYKKIDKKDIFREKLGIAEDKIIFLYQGALLKGRGIELLLDTFKNIDNSKAIILFMGYGELESTIKESAKEHKNIYFHKAVDSTALLDYTSSADFGISTIEDSCLSYRYSLPNKMFEYIMAEIPVIVSNLQEMKKFVMQNSVGVVATQNTILGLERAIEKAIRLDKIQLQENILNTKSIYNWKRQEKVLLNVYTLVQKRESQ